MPLQLPKVRHDLQFFEQEIEGESVVVVRDPIRNSFFKYNALQAAMLRSLDGVHSLDQMVASLSREYDVEIPRVAAERFVHHARKQLLLDIACAGVPERKAQRRVLEALRKKGFRFRELSARDETGKQTRTLSAEAVLFMGGMRHLRAGQPAKALDFFSAVLELNPKNERARMLAEAIQSSYVKAMALSGTEFPSVKLFDPTRLLAVLDRLFGWFLFSWVGVVAILGLMLFALYCYSITSYPSLDVTTFDVVLAIIITLVFDITHEIGHGLACYHYGGEVTEIGCMLFYVRPAPYCDTSSSYLFRDRRHKVIVQLAGAVTSLILDSLLFVATAFFHPGVVFYTAAQLLLWYTTYVTFINLIPFAKFDGYYALCDYVGVPNLRERSIKLLKGRVAQLVLGLPAAEEPLTPEKRQLFLSFAGLSVAFTAFWVYIGVFRLFAPLVESLHGIGLIGGTILLLVLMRKSVFWPLGRLAKLLVTERKQIFTVKRTLVMLLLCGAVIAPWTINTTFRFDAEFVFVPKQRVEVRAQQAGILRQVLVHEGETVQAGQPLALLVDDDLDHRLVSLHAQRDEIDAQLTRLRHGARRDEIQLAGAQVRVAAATQQQQQAEAAVAKAMADEGLGTAARATSTAASAGVSDALRSAARWKLATLQAGARPEDIDAAEAMLAEVNAQLDRADAQHAQLTISSPITGVVVTKHVADRLYEQLAIGDSVVEIDDTSELVAEIKLPTSAPLGEFGPGDRVELRPFGAPRDVEQSTIAHLRTDDAATSSGEHEPSDDRLVVVTSGFKPRVSLVGLGGHARLFGKRHSLAYSELYLPLQRVLRVRLWSLL